MASKHSKRVKIPALRSAWPERQRGERRTDAATTISRVPGRGPCRDPGSSPLEHPRDGSRSRLCPPLGRESGTLKVGLPSPRSPASPGEAHAETRGLSRCDHEAVRPGPPVLASHSARRYRSQKIYYGKCGRITQAHRRVRRRCGSTTRRPLMPAARCLMPRLLSITPSLTRDCRRPCGRASGRPSLTPRTG